MAKNFSQSYDFSCLADMIGAHDYKGLAYALDHGANPDLQGPDGRTLVHTAVMEDPDGYSLDILASHRARLDAIWPALNDWTASDIARFFNLPTAIATLKRHHAYQMDCGHSFPVDDREVLASKPYTVPMPGQQALVFGKPDMPVHRKGFQSLRAKLRRMTDFE